MKIVVNNLNGYIGFQFEGI